MATTKTRADLVSQALSNLSVLTAGQSVSDEDYAAVDGHIDQTFASLSARGIVSVGDDDQIPVEWFGPLAVILANDAAPEFGLQGMPASPADPNPVASAETRLRQMTYGRPTGERMEAEYF